MPRRDDFEIYHAKHPHVYEWFARFALEMIRAGVKCFGAPVVWERMRYETLLQTGTNPKLPNQLRPDYAREFIRRNPDLAKHIRVRQLRKK
jgi:hypothetical protein